KHCPSSASPSTNTSTPVPALRAPASSCSTLPKNYSLLSNPSSAVNANITFSIRCNHDYKLPLVMGMRINAFEDCIAACASQNTNYNTNSGGECIAVAHKPDSGQALTCWLKSALSEGDSELAEVLNKGVDGAVVVGR
ncbi:MAG: hypothetical protein Q9220_007284, partial [cf. Caloplaca sp. 1 TL-2023]